MKRRVIKKVISVVALLIIINLSYEAAEQQDLNDKIARGLANRLFNIPYVAALLQDKNHRNNKLKLIINFHKQEAYFVAMRHELFRMRLKTVDLSPAGISIANNFLELQGNGKQKLYLDIAKKILYFQGEDGKPLHIFARLKIKQPSSPQKGALFIAYLLDHKPIEFEIIPKYKKAYVYFYHIEKIRKYKKPYVFIEHLLFVMHVKKIKIRGYSINIYELKYMNRYKDGIYLNLERKLLYFRSGKTGIFAKVKINFGKRGKGIRYSIDWDKIPE